MSLLDRSGHLSELALDRLRFDGDALSPDLRAEADAHLATCPACQEALCALEAADASLDPALLAPPPPAPLPFLRPSRPRPARRWLAGAFGGAGLLAAAAIALFATRPSSAPDITLKGAPGFSLEIYIHDGQAPTLAHHDGFPIAPGDRMGFSVTTDAPGHLLILGRDDHGSLYPCFPQSGEDPPEAAPLAAHPAPFTLPAAMAFDDAPGDERITAVFCAEPFSAADLPTLDCEGPATTLTVNAAPCRARCLTLSRPGGAPRAGEPAPKEAP